jgi:mannose-6-phosphate isomerase-like protein (cupin superfamily)
MASFDFIDVRSLDAEGPGGTVRKTRRALGARAFGFNYFVLPPTQAGREHDHAEQNMEEVYFVVTGSGTMRIDDDEIELRPGRFVRVDPAARRLLTAGPEGLEFIAFGSPIDAPYEPPSWG